MSPITQDLLLTTFACIAVLGAGISAIWVLPWRARDWVPAPAPRAAASAPAPVASRT